MRPRHQSGNVRRPVEREEEGGLTGERDAWRLLSIRFREMDEAVKVPPSDSGWLPWRLPLKNATISHQRRASAKARIIWKRLLPPLICSHFLNPPPINISQHPLSLLFLKQLFPSSLRAAPWTPPGSRFSTLLPTERLPCPTAQKPARSLPVGHRFPAHPCQLYCSGDLALSTKQTCFYA